MLLRRLLCSLLTIQPSPMVHPVTLSRQIVSVWHVSITCWSEERFWKGYWVSLRRGWLDGGAQPEPSDGSWQAQRRKCVSQQSSDLPLVSKPFPQASPCPESPRWTDSGTKMQLCHLCVLHLWKQWSVRREIARLQKKLHKTTDSL